MDGLYIGLMSGTSLDAVDAALVSIKGQQIECLATHNETFPSTLQDELRALCQPGDNEIERMGVADRELGRLLAKAAQAVLTKHNTPARDIIAIGSHGQTIRHRPTASDRHPDRAFTLQIGDPNTIAEITGITTVGDCRRRDMAAGGQAAPLAPALHAAVFQAQECRAVVNIGGMSNITHLPASAGSDVTGFDCGPGNVLMNAWCKRHTGAEFDDNGAWAKSGSAIPELLQRMLDSEPCQRLFGSGPRSTGREDFDEHWLQQQLDGIDVLRAEDVQATLLALTVETISRNIESLQPGVESIWVCGGGAHNDHLMQSMQQRLQRPVSSTSALGIDPDWVEAIAFAWIARQTMSGAAGNLPSVTGAKRSLILGGIYLT